MSLTGMPRPLKFNSLNQFVLGNSQNFQQSHRTKSPRSAVFVMRAGESLYDRYNVNNLLLQKVSKNHLQVLKKNVVLDQEDIRHDKILGQTQSRTMYNNKAFSQTTVQGQPFVTTKQNNFIQTNVTGVNNYTQYDVSPARKLIAQTSQGFYVPEKSKEYSQNQLLFNFNKIADQKKAKKKQFLDTIQAKLNQIQLQAQELQQCQFQQAMELQQIQKIHSDIGRQLTANSFKGKVTQKVYQNMDNNQDDNQQQHKKPQSLHMNMGTVEINHVLNTHFEENQRLLDQIIRVKSKSRQKNSLYSTGKQDKWVKSPGKTKQFMRTGSASKSFSKTSVSQAKKNSLANQTQKKLIAATMKMPPKQGKR